MQLNEIRARVLNPWFVNIEHTLLMYLCEYRYIILNVTEYYNSLSIFLNHHCSCFFGNLDFHVRKSFPRSSQKTCQKHDLCPYHRK